MLNNGSELSNLFVKPERTDTDRINFYQANPKKVCFCRTKWAVDEKNGLITRFFENFRDAVDYVMDKEI